jgi:hypothetical protein
MSKVEIQLWCSFVNFEDYQDEDLEIDFDFECLLKLFYGTKWSKMMIFTSKADIDTNCKRLCCKNNFSIHDCPIRKQISRPMDLKQKWVAPLKRNPVRIEFTSIYSIGKWINGAKKSKEGHNAKGGDKKKRWRSFLQRLLFNKNLFLCYFTVRITLMSILTLPTGSKKYWKVKVSAKFIVRTWFLGVGTSHQVSHITSGRSIKFQSFKLHFCKK